MAPAKHEVGSRAAGPLLDRLSGGAPQESPRRHLDLLPRLTVRP
ncbi:hypothetical protein [Streptomyces sp. NPDC006463]